MHGTDRRYGVAVTTGATCQCRIYSYVAKYFRNWVRSKVFTPCASF